MFPRIFSRRSMFFLALSVAVFCFSTAFAATEWTGTIFGVTDPAKISGIPVKKIRKVGRTHRRCDRPGKDCTAGEECCSKNCVDAVCCRTACPQTISCAGYFEASANTCYNKTDITSRRCPKGRCLAANSASCEIQPENTVVLTCGPCQTLSGCNNRTPGKCKHLPDGTVCEGSGQCASGACIKP